MPSASSRNCSERGSYMGMTFHLSWRTIFLSKIWDEECEVVFFFFICCQSLLKIQMNCLFSDWFCFNMNSVKYSIFFSPPVSSPQKQDSASQSKQALLSPWPIESPPLQKEIRSLGKIGEEKKGQLLKHLVCFSPQPLLVPLLPSPHLHMVFSILLTCWKCRTLSMEWV